MKKLEEFIKTIGRGQVGIMVATATDYRMNKGKGANTNPYLGRVTKVTTYANVNLCCSYENSVNNQRDREGMDKDFVSTPLRGMEWVEYPYYLRSTKDPKQLYLNLEWKAKGACKVRSCLLVDGQLATQDQLEEIALWVTPKKESEGKQGVDNPTMTVRPKFEGIMFVGQGDAKWENPNYATYKTFAEQLWSSK